MSRRTIYLEIDAAVTSVLQKIKRTGDDDVLLVAPKGSRLLSSVSNAKLLKAETDRLGKTVSFATADGVGAILAERAGFEVERQLPANARTNLTEKTVRSRKGMGDIVVARRKLQPKTQKPSEESKPVRELSSLIGRTATEYEIKLPMATKVSFWHYRKIIISAAAVVVAAGLLVFLILPSAAITITARTENVNRDLELLVDAQAEAEDTANLVIPGRLVAEEVVESETFKASGKRPVGKKATGSVRFHNFSNNSLILRRSTTHLEANGKTYVLLQDAGSIRPTRGTPEAVDETSLGTSIAIEAAEAGTLFNLPAGTRLEVYNEVFGNQPQILYAVADAAVSGGTDETVVIVSQEDVDAAREVVQKSMLDRVSEKLSGDQTLVANAAIFELQEEALSHEVGQDASEFQLTQSSKVSALVFDTDDVRAVIAERIVNLLPDNKYLDPGAEEKLSSEFVSLDLAAGAGTLRAHYTAKVRYSVNAEFLSQSLPGKSVTEVKEILLSRPEIQDVKVELWPFWVKKVPNIKSKIDLKVVQ